MHSTCRAVKMVWSPSGVSGRSDRCLTWLSELSSPIMATVAFAKNLQSHCWPCRPSRGRQATTPAASGPVGSGSNIRVYKSYKHAHMAKKETKRVSDDWKWNMKPRQTNLPTKSQTSSLAHHSFTHPRLCHQKETQHIETEESERCLPRAIVNHCWNTYRRDMLKHMGAYIHI
jgi:hypothetical protein